MGVGAAQHGLIHQDHILYSPSVDVGNGESRYVVSQEIGLTDASTLNFMLFVDVESLVVGGGEEVRFYLQELKNGNWEDVGFPQASVAADNGDGTYCIILSIGLEIEAMVLPLTNLVRLTVDTGASSSVKVTKVTVFNRL